LFFARRSPRCSPKAKGPSYILPSVSTANAGNEENIATAPYTRKAAYQYGWDWGPHFVTIGVWKPVWLQTWDGARIENFHIHQLKVTGDAAEVAAELEIESTHPVTTAITVNYGNVATGVLNSVITQTVQLDSGTNTISTPLRISSPKP
jgi:beta-mannosidase